MYSHQEKIVAEDKKKTGIFLGTGSGKTRIALMLAKGNTLVICPKTQRDDKNWEREYAKLGLAYSLTVKSKEDFKKIAPTYVARFNTIIIDEAHTCLGVSPTMKYVKRVQVPKTSQIFEEIDKFITKTQPERLYLVTATIIRSPLTVWAASKLLGHIIDFKSGVENFIHNYQCRGVKCGPHEVTILVRIELQNT